jgi:hypothetical protein
MASRQLLIPRIAAIGTLFSPLPCQALHGYGITIAHRVEVEVGADGRASAPPSGTATGRWKQAVSRHSAWLDASFKRVESDDFSS